MSAREVAENECASGAKPAAANVLQQQARFDAFVDRYNRSRPHQALAMKVPADLYARSPRVYLGLEDLAYPANVRVLTVGRREGPAEANDRTRYLERRRLMGPAEVTPVSVSRPT